VTINLASSITIVIGVLGILALIAAGFSTIRSTYVKEQLESLRGDRDDQAVRINRQDEEIEQLKRDNDQLIAKCNVLERLVTGRDQLERIEATVNEIRAKVAV